MTVTGVVRVDLTDVAEDRQRSRVGALATAPEGVTVEVIVGALRVNPDAARLLRQFTGECHLHVVVKGESFSVSRWVSALRSGSLMGMLL